MYYSPYLCFSQSQIAGEIPAASPAVGLLSDLCSASAECRCTVIPGT